MKKLGGQIALLCVLVITTIALVVSLPTLDDAYDLSIVDKHRILENTASPKIVLAGGSNLAFGIDSVEILNVFHIPAVNISVIANFGLGRILDDVSPFLNSGDILVIAPEYEHFTDLWNGDHWAYALIYYTRQFRMLLPTSYYELPRNFPLSIVNHLKAAIARYFPPNPFRPYSRDGFNEYGDYVKHLTMENQFFAPAENIGVVNQKYLTYFFRFIDDFAARGITVVLSYPSYETESFDNSAREIAALDAAFRAKENLKVISNPKDYAFPAGLFFDSAYHLNAEGRALRTKQLIEDLKAAGILE